MARPSKLGDVVYEIGESVIVMLYFLSNCEGIAGLIKGLYDSRPEEFRKYFLDDLEAYADKPESVALDMYGGLDATCGTWYHAILNPLIEHADTRARAIAAMEKIIERLPAEKKHFLQDLLPKD